jgi:hypothetical protein
MADANYWSALMNGGAPAGMLPEQEAADPSVSPLLKLLQRGQKPNSLLNAKKFPVVAADGPNTPAEARARMAQMQDSQATPDAAPTVAGLEASVGKAQVSPSAKGSGLTSKEELSRQMLKGIKDDMKNQLSSQLYADPEQIKELYNQTAQLPAFVDQANGLQNQKDMLAMAASAPSDAWSGPIAGLLQSQFPGQNAAGIAAQAAREETPEQQRDKILAMGGKIQDDQRDLSKGIFDAIGKQKAGTYLESLGTSTNSQDILKALSSAGANDPDKGKRAAGTGGDAKMKLRVFDQFQKYSGKDRESLQGAENAVNLLNSGTKVGDTAVVALLARASGEVGNLSEFDQKQYAGSQAVADRIRRAITKVESGRLDEADRADLTLLAKTYASYRRDLLKKNAAYFADNYAPELGLDAKSTKRMLVPDGGWGLDEKQINPRAKAKASGEEMVAVVAPNGIAGKLPKSKVDDYVKNKGFKLKAGTQ